VQRPDGELLCAFRRAPSRKYLYGAPHDTHTDPNSQLVLLRSGDDGDTWTTSPELLYAHPLGGSQDPCMVQLNGGTIVCTSYGWAQLPLTETTGPQQLRYQFMGGHVLQSHDDGKSWRGPFIPPDIRDGASSASVARPTFNRGAPIVSSKGELLWAAVKSGAEGARQPSSVHLLASHDGGKSWEVRGAIAADPKVTFNETSLVQTQRGDIVAFLRTDGLKGHGAIARSADDGRTWSAWQDLGYHAEPLQATRLQDGRILLAYGYRRKPYGVRARLLNADASDAATAPEFVISDDGGAVDLGYPWSLQLQDGNVLVVYYMNVADGPRHIAGTLLRLD
jgi:hypothetical protein